VLILASSLLFNNKPSFKAKAVLSARAQHHSKPSTRSTRRRAGVFNNKPILQGEGGAQHGQTRTGTDLELRFRFRFRHVREVDLSF
jgi:hypothetical protein